MAEERSLGGGECEMARDRERGRGVERASARSECAVLVGGRAG